MAAMGPPQTNSGPKLRLPESCIRGNGIAESDRFGACPPVSPTVGIRRCSSTRSRPWSVGAFSAWRWAQPVLGPATPDPGADSNDHDEPRHDPVFAVLAGADAADREEIALFQASFRPEDFSLTTYTNGP